MNETIQPKMKCSHIKWGDAVVFGDDSGERRRLSDLEAVQRFNQLWQTTLAEKVIEAEEITWEKAHKLLDDRFKSYAVTGFIFRQFSLDEVPFVARITPAGVCDQFWSLGTHRDPTRLCMHFENVKEKESFDKLAQQHGWQPKVLALRLCMDFMKAPNFPNR